VKSGRVFLEVWKSDQFDWLGGWFKIDGFFRECKGGFYGDFAVSFQGCISSALNILVL